MELGHGLARRGADWVLLGSRSAGRRRDVLDGRRQLDVREPDRGVEPERRRRAGLALLEDDGLDAQGVVGHAVDRRELDRRAAVEHALDLDAVDVLRSHDDHVRGAVEDRQVAVAVDLGEVVRAEPAVGRDGLGRRLDVVAAAGEERRAADPDLADALARRGAEAVLLDAVHDADAGGRAAAAPIEARPAVVVRELARLDGPQGADAVAVARHGSNVSTMEKRT